MPVSAQPRLLSRTALLAGGYARRRVIHACRWSVMKRYAIGRLMSRATSSSEWGCPGANQQPSSFVGAQPIVGLTAISA